MKKIKSTKTIMEKNKKNHKKIKKKTVWRNTVAIHSVFKEKKSTKTILKKKTQKNEKKKKKTILEEKMKKNMQGKLKLNSQPAQY
jgi:hypothetical protein